MTQDQIALITIIVAGYGAVLATVSFVLSLVLGIVELRRGLPKIKVKISIGKFINPGTDSSEPLILVKAINQGSGNVELNTFGYLVRSGAERIVMKAPPARFPHTLNERKSVTASFACSGFRASDERADIVAFFFRDEMENVWKVQVSRRLRKQIMAAQESGRKISEYF